MKKEFLVLKLLSSTFSSSVEGCKPNVQVDTEKGRTAVHAGAAGGFLDIISCLKMVCLFIWYYICFNDLPYLYKNDGYYTGNNLSSHS